MNTRRIFAGDAQTISVKGRTVRDLTNVETVYRKTIRTISLKLDGISMRRNEKLLRVLCPDDLADILHAIFALYDDDQEHLVMLVLNGGGDITGFKLIATGAQDHALADSRVIFRNALMLGGAAIIIAHNHPSGNPAPSKDDLDITRKLAKAGDVMDVELLDHIIYTSDQQLSLRKAYPRMFGK